MSNKAILCVDDELDVLESLVNLLRRHFGGEFEIEKAENAEEAFEVIDEFAQEDLKLLVVVSDWLMPGIRGDEFLINVHQKFPTVVKVMLTGQADEEAVVKAREQADLFACISKPWDPDEFIGTIKEGLKRL